MSSPTIIENLEPRMLFSIHTTTDVIKVPGPTDVLVITAVNPAGHEVPGQSSVEIIPNRLAHLFRD